MQHLLKDTKERKKRRTTRGRRGIAPSQTDMFGFGVTLVDDGTGGSATNSQGEVVVQAYTLPDSRDIKTTRTLLHYTDLNVLGNPCEVLSWMGKHTGLDVDTIAVTAPGTKRKGRAAAQVAATQIHQQINDDELLHLPSMPAAASAAPSVPVVKPPVCRSEHAAKKELRWLCHKCKCRADQTTFIREGAPGELLCNQCGLHYQKLGS
jgi:hypothetical protein